MKEVLLRGMKYNQIKKKNLPWDSIRSISSWTKIAKCHTPTTQNAEKYTVLSVIIKIQIHKDKYIYTFLRWVKNKGILVAVAIFSKETIIPW